jgi:hypothetical protein
MISDHTSFDDSCSDISQIAPSLAWMRSRSWPLFHLLKMSFPATCTIARSRIKNLFLIDHFFIQKHYIGAAPLDWALWGSHA